MSSVEYFDLPIVSLKSASQDPRAGGRDVVKALETVGFLGIVDIPEFDVKKLQQCCSWFFQQSWEVKKSVMKRNFNKDNTNIYRGYFPVLEDSFSRKEGFEIAADVPYDDPDVISGNFFYEHSTWPPEDGESFEFKKTMLEMYLRLHNIAMEILRLVSVGLGIRETSFEHFFNEKPCSTFRLIHYPPWKGPPPEGAKVEDGKVVTTPVHTDSGFLTLLATFHYHGLEVMTSEGKWLPVRPISDGLVLNVGDLFSKMVGGRFHATQHRVLDIGIDRYSVPFFLEPRFDANINVDMTIPFEDQRYERRVEKYGPWVLKRMAEKNFFEFKDLPNSSAEKY
ncbi:hypothetical protein FSP39_006827 [Pinctada imbricata]|uniref:Fe2OG dioxygenase domain-containing protein n=1 Tax=Pinctada imbricata TaxID=66713 RepID=A0AA89C9P1_PINIB|nr:hypothetical protein FSP39_006827 [Pinctada imbricata]